MSMGGAGGPIGQGSQFTALMQNVQDLESIHKNGESGRVEVIAPSAISKSEKTGSFRGRKVVHVKPRGNLLKRLVTLLSPTRAAREYRAREREAKALLHDQVLLALGDNGLTKQDKKRLVEDVASGIIPGFSRSERETIREKSLAAIQRPEAIGVMLSEAEQGIKAFPRLVKSIPGVSLFNAREALKGYYTTLILAPDRIPDSSELHQSVQTLQQHFNNTRQPDGYQDLVNEVIQEIIHSLPERLSQNGYHQVLSEWNDLPSTHRDKAIARIVDRTIDNATRTELSIHGHPRELVIKESYHFLQALSQHPDLTARFALGRMEPLKRQLQQEQAQIRVHLDKLSAAVPQLNVEEIRGRLEAGGELTKEEGMLIAESRRVLLDIQLTAGRRWDLKLLSQLDHWTGDEGHHAKLQKIQEIGSLRGEEIDLAQLDWLIGQHKKVKQVDGKEVHPRIAIEGAGPTGLILALSQFEAGADVAIFEKRSTEYDRVQVVRLDPKWMDMLKFYLGEHYYELFGEGAEGKGVVRADGFGEIVTHRLEEGLHYRLTELMARNYDEKSDPDKPPSLERLAAFELEEVESDVGGYQVKARYNPAYDVAKQKDSQTFDLARYTPEERIKHRPVDMLICAGGKNTLMRDKFMTDKTVTNAKPYGVCSWEGKKGQELPNPGLDTFQDFREMVVFGKDFHQHFRERLAKELESLPGSSDTIKSEIKPEQLAELERLTLNQGMQTRCFENKNLVYIGMELPEPFDEYCKKLESAIKKKVEIDVAFSTELSSVEESGKQAEKKVREGLKAVHKAWFQAVAHYYGIDDPDSLHATSDKINNKFAAAFPVQQHRVERNVVTQSANGHDLTVTVAGDAAASPHFMRYSGLTGARENVLHLQNFTRKIANDTNPFGPELHQSELEARQQKTADFVIERGEVFLGPQRST
ncbi:hypothetical protein [Endozoicomonas numazuensis]|uniref:FAD-binding domain-containing protein n=1 Tax=Endozoicomonas numazuensis TaxID=1137799 RepID=A0A081NGD8_9GAMM|nr:hypothetical protein [Endozoicomonas numazuensis]KEQ17511.1 hypothetical protein GZ78_17295 [Endozoicomonas numazuensis]